MLQQQQMTSTCAHRQNSTTNPTESFGNSTKQFTDWEARHKHGKHTWRRSCNSLAYNDPSLSRWAQHLLYTAWQRSAYIRLCGRSTPTLRRRATTNKILEPMQQHLLLRPTGTLTVGNTASLFGRNITNRGDYYGLGLADSYNKTLFEEEHGELQASNSISIEHTNNRPWTTPQPRGTQSISTISPQTSVDDLHKTWHLLRNKRVSASITTANISRSAEAQKPFCCIKGPTYYKQIIRPTVKLTEATHDLNVYVDSDWAGCVDTRESKTGFTITFLGGTTSYGSRTQATIALSSAEAELYAINTGSTEALQNLLTDLLKNNQANIKIHIDPSSGKSIATRIGTGKKTKHFDLKHLFIQRLVALNPF